MIVITVDEPRLPPFKPLHKVCILPSSEYPHLRSVALAPPSKVSNLLIPQRASGEEATSIINNYEGKATEFYSQIVIER